MLILALFAFIAASPVQASDVLAKRPADWIEHFIPMHDSRPGHRDPRCGLEIVEIAFPKDAPKSGAILLIPGLFQNGFTFDLMPEKGISYARYLMREKHLKVYLLHVRGLGKSCYPAHSDLDDIAIDDIPPAIDYVANQLEHQKIFVLGHSEGGIAIQAALSGLSRCGDRNCFSTMDAELRQENVAGLAISAGNVDMSIENPRNPLPQLSMLSVWLDYVAALPLAFADGIPASLLTKKLAPATRSNLAYWKFWEVLYHVPNVSQEARLALYNRTLDFCNVGVIQQFAYGAAFSGVRNSSLQRYSDFVKDIRVPTAQITYGLDRFAEPRATYRDDFLRIGAPLKRFFVIDGKGHEDYAMNPALHSTHSEMIDWLLGAARL